MRRIRWWGWVVVVSVGSVVLTYLVGVALMLRVNLPFQELREDTVPAGWILEEQSERLTGLFGQCYTVTWPMFLPCPFVDDEYMIPGGEYSEAELVQALESAGVVVWETDCQMTEVDENGWVTLCAVDGVKDGYRVRISVGGFANKQGLVTRLSGGVWIRLLEVPQSRLEDSF